MGAEPTDVIEVVVTSSMTKEGRTPVLYLGDRVRVRSTRASLRGRGTVTALDVRCGDGRQRVEVEVGTYGREVVDYHEVTRV